ncbi:MAG: hypothetical protein UEW60_07000, partial [Christensenellales bacterium]|nr:hypothetical protein [Christensenellales bacterium]
TSFFLFLSRHFVVAYLCCTSFSPPSAKFPCSKSHLGLDFLFAGFHVGRKENVAFVMPPNPPLARGITLMVRMAFY